MKAIRRRLGRAARTLAAGFTLVELMVAVTGGLFVTIAVFMLAKQATGLYQSEVRLSNATLGSIVGFERLRADIARAGFGASPNVLRDPKLCGIPDASWPAYMKRLTAVFIQRSASAPQILKDNGLTPDEIVLAGSYATNDQFEAEAIDDSGTITLQTATGPMARLGYAGANAAQQTALLTSVFGVGRILRVVDRTGRVQFGTISAVNGGARPQIVLQANRPALLKRENSPILKCGVAGEGAGTVVNPVNLIKYSLRNLSSVTRYAPLYDGGAPAIDKDRSELVREELDADGNGIAGTEEIVSEFAVDLAFGISVTQVIAGAGGVQQQAMSTIPASDPTNIAAWAGDPSKMDLTVRGPQLVRVVRARLSVRSREADRTSGMPAALTDGGGLPIGAGLYRVGLGTGGGSPYARVRTVQADIALRNLREATWL